LGFVYTSGAVSRVVAPAVLVVGVNVALGACVEVLGVASGTSVEVLGGPACCLVHVVGGILLFYRQSLHGPE
jgi:hypothetical protein